MIINSISLAIVCGILLILLLMTEIDPMSLTDFTQTILIIFDTRTMISIGILTTAGFVLSV